jgi:hypothetical protein
MALSELTSAKLRTRRAALDAPEQSIPAANKSAQPLRILSLKNLRLLHRYMGLVFSPAILFFAFTGALQTFDLHSPNKSTGYVPPAWVVEMAQLHKKQTLSLSKEKSKPAKSDSADPANPKKTAQPQKSALPLKCFVLVMSVGLIATTILGIYMAFRFGEAPGLIWGMLIGGTLLPIAMIFL